MLYKKLKNLRHLFYSWYGSIKYHHPSEEIFVIGITGTTGKSSVIHFLRQVLEFAGFKVGSLSTVDFYINGKTILNDKKMTMVGKMFIQEKLREMVSAGCEIAIVETTSEGRLQHRHRFINYDTILLTNLYPEHIEAHGGFENYKKAKLDIFEYVAGCERKRHRTYDGGRRIGKTVIVNGDSGYSDEFLKFNFEDKIVFGSKSYVLHPMSYVWSDVSISAGGLNFNFENTHYSAPLYGEHNIENLAGVIAIAKSLNISEENIQQAIAQIKSPPGRIEFIPSASLRTGPEANKLDFQVIVDYAFEPVALQKLYDVVDLIKPTGKIIHVCGSTGGGRDKSRREPIGKLVGEKSDIFIITNEDPYDENPLEIMEQVKVGAIAMGKKENMNMFMILDRKQAIEKALSLAQNGDLVIITGKGSEQKMCVAGGKMIDWDDRKIARDYLDKYPVNT